MATMELTKVLRFSAAHRLMSPALSRTENRRLYGACVRGHGHTYTLEVTLRGPVDSRTGMVVDLDDVKRVVGETVLARFDHAFINDDAAFPPGVLPTTENLVRVAWDLLAAKLGADRLARLRLWEDPTLYVDYRGEA